MGEEPDIISETLQCEEAAWYCFAAVVLNYDCPEKMLFIPLP